MTSLQIILSVFLAGMFPTVTALLGIILNRKDLADFRADVHNELRMIHSGIGDIRERLVKLETTKIK